MTLIEFFVTMYSVMVLCFLIGFFMQLLADKIERSVPKILLMSVLWPVTLGYSCKTGRIDWM